MDPYAEIAPYYDWEHDEFRDDIEFYLNAIRDGPVLEVGVGTGRIALPLARAGHEVWGVDPSEAMMARARDRLAGIPRVHLRLGSVDQLDQAPRFGTTLLPLNTLWHAADLDDQIEMLQAVHRRMTTNGLLFVDLSNPLSMADRQSRGELRQRFRRSVDGCTITSYSSVWDDEADQVLTLALTYEESRAGVPVQRSFAELELRYLYRFELDAALRLAHFAVLQVYGSYDLQPYSSASPNLIVVAGVA
jgi:SAM-dependent methyltransferase